MRLTNYTDYSLRVLIYLATKHDNELVTIQEIAEVYGVSKNHLMKVVFDLGKLGYLETIRGRYGGIRLLQKPEEISLGQLVRETEEDFNLVECFDHDKNLCVISPVCKLRGVLQEALRAYLNVLDQYTLADLVHNTDALRSLLFQSPDP